MPSVAYEWSHQTSVKDEEFNRTMLLPFRAWVPYQTVAPGPSLCLQYLDGWYDSSYHIAATQWCVFGSDWCQGWRHSIKSTSLCQRKAHYGFSNIRVLVKKRVAWDGGCSSPWKLVTNHRVSLNSRAAAVRSSLSRPEFGLVEVHVASEE